MSIYNNDQKFPDQNINISDRQFIRGMELINLEITPFIYYPKLQELVVIEEIEIRIKKTSRPHEVISKSFPRSRVFERLVNNAIINPELYETRTDDYQRPAILYVCGGNSISQNLLGRFFRNLWYTSKSIHRSACAHTDWTGAPVPPATLRITTAPRATLF